MNFFRKKYYRLLTNYHKSTGNEVGFAKASYKLKNNKELDLHNPKEFVEKLQWLKFNLYDESYGNFVDKYEVRKYVEEKVGKEYLIDLVDVYDNPETKDLQDMPEKFVLKGTHGSGYNIIVKDKSQVDWDKTKVELQGFLSKNYYHKYFERVYKDVQPRIVAEHYLDQLDSDNIIDYKFFCIHGKVECIWVKTFVDGKYRNCYYDLNWKKISPDTNTSNYLSKEVKRPDNLEEMIEVAEKLSEEFVFIRVDLYSVKNKIYFGELTFFPWGGYKRLTVEHLNHKLGEKIKLPEDSMTS
ncbi:ATP-grasp fold amidoligase family protein [Mangrovimonas xylaniphaga]|uniref:ATP-grasp fold amidoligase family protein n=1 Tax=Mangrovimonas xylaniphaga TaxID=1645915 RepID=UPI0006B5EB20|nr:ATP-grasp fold amidoligase family protein [Mangrovimonas xylaniphaga]